MLRHFRPQSSSSSTSQFADTRAVAGQQGQIWIPSCCRGYNFMVIPGVLFTQGKCLYLEGPLEDTVISLKTNDLGQLSQVISECVRKCWWEKGTQERDNKSARTKLTTLNFSRGCQGSSTMQRALFLFSEPSANSVPVRKAHGCSVPVRPGQQLRRVAAAERCGRELRLWNSSPRCTARGGRGTAGRLAGFCRRDGAGPPPPHRDTAAPGPADTRGREAAPHAASVPTAPL